MHYRPGQWGKSSCEQRRLMSIAMRRNGERVRETALIATTLAGNYATRSATECKRFSPYRRSVTADPAVEYIYDE